ncbi:imelysin family protein [Mesorhizobium xinjiangense]|uniref:imelysin family protein n=1 Tax=Mesorhizobium xinjiangense TaxID=2678685 RepID=UPI0012ED8958|nr:imelysin family protein [Mesorhizobium xinjiangense]
MLRPLLIGLAAATFCAAPMAHAAEPSINAVKAAIDNYVRPAYAAFAQRSVAAAKTMEALCQAPSPDRLAAAQDAFMQAAGAWSFIEPVRIGPITEDNRLERLLFWPDRRSRGLKQVQGILAGKDETAASLASLQKKSVAMQGFGALEFILFGTGSEALGQDGASFRCAYGQAVADNIAQISSAVSDEWASQDGIAGLWTAPSPDNPLYRDDAEAVSELFDILVHGLEMVRDVRIDGFLGEEPADDRPKRALYWRSGQTIASIRQNLGGMLAVYDGAGLGDNLGDDAEWIDGSIRFEFANLERALSDLDAPIAELLADETARGRIVYARIVTSGLSDLVGTGLSGEYGLTAGFSSLDGD